jgi:hypothetical protein
MKNSELRGLSQLITVAIASIAVTANAGEMCTTDTCKAGTKAITHATKTEPYFACPTRELADYTNFVLGLVAMDAMMGASLNISPQTGEPEVEGETKAMLDHYRTAANAPTYDAAISLCHAGKSKHRVILLNVSDDTSLAVWVHDERQNENYWMPISGLNKR